MTGKSGTAAVGYNIGNNTLSSLWTKSFFSVYSSVHRVSHQFFCGTSFSSVQAFGASGRLTQRESATSTR
jgi:hypothetical protein